VRPIIQEIQTSHTPESLVEQLDGENGIVLLRSAMFDSPQAQYSFVTARPFSTFRSFGSRCETVADATHIQSICRSRLEVALGIGVMT
jgi:anthranilate/para-aminobenzoate synthase component I